VQTFATAILLVHLAIVAFNVGGLIVVPVGAALHWHWVRGFWWRLLHLLSLFVVAAQALFGRACFLTLWQFAAEHGAAADEPPPLIATWINRLLYWPLPHGVFVAAYLAVFAYTVALWVWVRPTRATDPPITTR